MKGGVYPDPYGRPHHWRIRFPDATGKLRQKTELAPTRRAALRLQADLAYAARRDSTGATTRASRVTLAEYWKGEFWPDMEGGKVAESTALARLKVWKNHLRKPLGHRKLSELDTVTVDQAYDSLRRVDERGKGRSLAESTAYGVDRVLTAVVRHAARRGLFGPEGRRRGWQKPWDSPPKPQPKPRRGLNWKEMAKAIEHAREIGGAQFAAAITLAGVAGVRRDEMAPIQRRHVRERDDGAGLELELWKTKTGEPAVLELRGDAARVVRAWLEERDARFPESDWLFPVHRRTRVRGRVVREAGAQRSSYVIDDRRWNKLRKKLGLAPGEFREHDLRGSFIKLGSGVAMSRDVQEAARHKSGDTTAIYQRQVASPAAGRVAQAIADRLSIQGATAGEP